MKIKTMIFDLDGTLLNSNQKISLKNKKAIEEAKKAGIQIILASGRKFSDMERFAHELGVEYIITMNGAAIYSIHNKQLLYSKFIESNITQQIKEYIFKEKVDISFFFGLNEVKTIKAPNIEKDVNNKNKINTKILDDGFLKEIYKIMICTLNESDKNTLHYEKLKNSSYNNKLQITKSSPRCIEINALNVSKGQGLQILSKYIDIDFKTTTAFGDGGNDLEMLKLVKYPFVMKNCVLELEKTNFPKIGDNNSGDLAKKIRELI